MQFKKNIITLSLLSTFFFAAGCLLFTGCSREAGKKSADRAIGMAPQSEMAVKKDRNSETYDEIVENPFLLAKTNPLSTFSIDVDTASYTNVRRFLLKESRLPPKGAVRVEEMLNYFDYNYPQPEGEHPIAVAAEVARCPWQPKHHLVRVGIQGLTIPDSQIPPRNLVFLLDTSGSMRSSDRLPLFKKALRLLVRQLDENDRVAIVAYANATGLVLPSTPGDQQQTINGAIGRLEAGGSTNGGAGIQLAYRIAQENYIDGGVNRVILGTDGDFNVGTTSNDALVNLIKEKRKSGVFLTVLGFGRGNLKDSKMQKLAQYGNGEYGYIDSMAEAHRVFVQKVGGLVPIAKDVKVQVEFNPANVQAYRLVGYENRMLRAEDFKNAKKDAGDMGSGHTVTAFYEIVPPGVKIDLPQVDPLKYQKPGKLATDAGKELLTVKVSYLRPEGKNLRILTQPVHQQKNKFEDASNDFQFAASVAAFGLVLRDSKYKGNADYGEVYRWAVNSQIPQMSPRSEFLRLVTTANRLAKNED